MEDVGSGSAAVQLDKTADDGAQADFVEFIARFFAEEESVDEIGGFAGSGFGQAAFEDLLRAEGDGFEEPLDGVGGADEFDFDWNIREMIGASGFRGMDLDGR